LIVEISCYKIFSENLLCSQLFEDTVKAANDGKVMNEWEEERERKRRASDEGLLKTIVHLMPNLANWNRGHNYKRSKHYFSDRQ
jgi:hypothetical protein